MTKGVLQILATWLERRESERTALGINTSLTWGPSNRNPGSAWVDFETRGKSARLMLWSNGEADLMVGDLVSGEILLEEHREILTEVGLDNAHQTITSWLG